MLTEEVHSAGVLEAKVAQHEDAAHEKRNWVRLTFDCNNKCVFCLDSLAHDGEMRNPEEVKQQIRAVPTEPRMGADLHGDDQIARGGGPSGS